MLSYKLIDTPIDLNHKLRCPFQRATVDAIKYQRLVGQLIYLSHTHLDLAFAVIVVNQFMHSPHGEQLEIVYKILRYLKRILGKGLLFRKDKYIRIETSIDVDWARSISDQRSTSGYCTFIGVGDLEEHEADSCC